MKFYSFVFLLQSWKIFPIIKEFKIFIEIISKKNKKKKQFFQFLLFMFSVRGLFLKNATLGFGHENKNWKFICFFLIFFLENFQKFSFLGKQKQQFFFFHFCENLFFLKIVFLKIVFLKKYYVFFYSFKTKEGKTKKILLRTENHIQFLKEVRKKKNFSL